MGSSNAIAESGILVAADFGFGTPLKLSDDGGILAAGSNPVITETENAIRLWDTHNGKPLGVCKGHTQGVKVARFFSRWRDPCVGQ